MAVFKRLHNGPNTVAWTIRIAVGHDGRLHVRWYIHYLNGKYDLSSQNLTCFDSGSLILGGTVMDRQDFIDFGVERI